MIVSSIFPGHLRLRTPVLKEADVLQVLIDISNKYSIITNFEHNIKTGSVLIEYDEKKLSVDKLLKFKEKVLYLNKLCECYSFQKNKSEIIDLLKSLDSEFSETI